METNDHTKEAAQAKNEGEKKTLKINTNIKAILNVLVANTRKVNRHIENLLIKLFHTLLPTLETAADKVLQKADDKIKAVKHLNLLGTLAIITLLANLSKDFYLYFQGGKSFDSAYGPIGIILTYYAIKLGAYAVKKVKDKKNAKSI